MKKTIKFKEKNGNIKLSKKADFSKKERKIINKELEKYKSLSQIRYLFYFSIILEKKKSTKIKYMKFKKLKEIFVNGINTFNPLINISKEDLGKHFFEIGRTETGKSDVLKQNDFLDEEIDYVDDNQKEEEKRERKRQKRKAKEQAKKDTIWRESKEYKDHFSGKAYKEKK